MVWHQDQVSHSQLPPATGYGWKTEEDRLDPIPITDPPVAASITQRSNVAAKRNTGTHMAKHILLMHIPGTIILRVRRGDMNVHVARKP